MDSINHGWKISTYKIFHKFPKSKTWIFDTLRLLTPYTAFTLHLQWFTEHLHCIRHYKMMKIYGRFGRTCIGYMSDFTFTDWVTSLWLFTFMHWRRNGNPLQCSCLENPRDEGALVGCCLWAARSQTWLKRLSSSSSIGYIQILQHFIYGTWVSMDFDICTGPGTKSLWIPRTSVQTLKGCQRTANTIIL